MSKTAKKICIVLIAIVVLLSCLAAAALLGLLSTDIHILAQNADFTIPTTQEQTVPTVEYSWKDYVSFDESKFYTLAVEYPECTQYYVCYERDENVVVDLGLRDDWLIAESRIYYLSGYNLCSVAFNGEDKQRMDFVDGENISGVEKLFRFEDGWLYCRLRRYVTIEDNPVASPGLHTEQVDFRIKTDFSAYEELTF